MTQVHSGPDENMGRRGLLKGQKPHLLRLPEVAGGPSARPKCLPATPRLYSPLRRQTG